MASMNVILRKAELFRQDCLKYDIPRLKAEVLPDDVNVEADVAYKENGGEYHLLDTYFTGDRPEGKEAYILIHGGAFVYGTKENDKNFGMRLAAASGIPVININYTLMPDGTLQDVMDDIDKAVAFAKERYGFAKFHYVGDSAGGYLAMLSAIRDGDSLSASLICGCYKLKKNDFPGAFFKHDEKYVYDLYSAAGRLTGKDIAIITGSEDYMRKENIKLAKYYGKDCIFYNPETEGERIMAHVFPISHPDWPEGIRTIEIISSFARKSC